MIERYHDRPLLDVALRIYQRDRESAGSVVGSAVAFRLFLFFVPLTLFIVGVLGFLARWIEPADVNSTAGLGGTIAAQINTAMSAPDSTRRIATIAGLFGMAWAGRSLSKVLITASCLAWQIPLTTKASVRVIGSIIGLIAAIVLVGSAVNRIGDHYGPGAAGLSFLAVAALYGVAWMALSTFLRRRPETPARSSPVRSSSASSSPSCKPSPSSTYPGSSTGRPSCTGRSPPRSSRSAGSSSSVERWSSASPSTLSCTNVSGASPASSSVSRSYGCCPADHAGSAPSSTCLLTHRRVHQIGPARP